MAVPQYAIMRFMKYKGPEFGKIEAYDERTKGPYGSKPDIDPSRAHLNFHLVELQGRYRAEAERQIREALKFIKQKQNSNTIISAMVHMDEKTPHMHLSFVPLTVP